MSETSNWRNLLSSPTVVFSFSLIVVYVITGLLVSDFLSPVDTAINTYPTTSGSIVVLHLAQCQGPGLSLPFPWTLVTSVFLHSGILHIVSNLFFLVIFGFILEEHVTKRRWVLTFLLTGFMGNVTFALAGLGGLIPPSCGVGASGAVYGIIGTALGLKAAILIIFLAGLDLFAGGGFFAHFGGLITGFVLREFWIRKPD
ncbi:MAG TPA: rhomboid family intramembrane serine protease [Candidatus Bathyarchaeia archaeon]|nr:rhomboid family intramembrane serine protease [Candidatus Bathyarchaeia archaeon]